MKIIFVTGGVMSGLGKGVTASSIGRILKSSGYSISMVKMDPYLQVDAGTMSPFEHGEVYVTKDGGETDLDLGNYERFINNELTSDCNITSGKVYYNVIKKERRGDFLGKTVQTIPHITDEIKNRILSNGKDSDVLIVEVGGTVGDIEGLPFIEAIRQLKADMGRKNVCYVHVAPVIYLDHSNENKTKPIQHSIKKLREYGLKADILVARTTKDLKQKTLDKISLFCDIEKEYIIQAIDVKSIYKVPIMFENQNMSKIVQNKLGLNYKKPNLENWKNFVDRVISDFDQTVTVAIVGKYAEFEDSYLSLIESIVHSGASNKVNVSINWIQSENLEKKGYKNILDGLNENGQMDVLIIPGGFGSRGIEGKINAINYVRKNKIPFLGLCLGLQTAIIEYARNVCGLVDAHSSEFDETTKDPVIDYIPEQRQITNKGGTMRLGDCKAILKKGTKVYSLYGDKEIIERHRHRYEVNPEYHDILKENGLIFSGKSPNGRLVEFIELDNHPYFVATQAHPEFKSRPTSPHVLFDGLIKASL